MDGRRRSPVLSCPFLPCLQRLSHISDHHRSYLPAIRAHPVFDPTNTLNLSLLCWVSMSLCSALQEEEEESGFPCLPAQHVLGLSRAGDAVWPSWARRPAATKILESVRLRTLDQWFNVRDCWNKVLKHLPLPNFCKMLRKSSCW